ncbi:sn-1-specific diacylglycerol lipase ABHD11 [Drosophila virilis]|uniref:sn-1-specific diacylglycerol lipase ABHD11 n=1 Tax=Drosophila virilis TaxID=7244 RepID=B4M490_DROVI|nr:protein ABHD11 [Drosophila virilis]EDW59451.2 uncharacterized protein Dvir_GJ10894 [Drosophila virilis]
MVCGICLLTRKLSGSVISSITSFSIASVKSNSKFSVSKKHLRRSLCSTRIHLNRSYGSVKMDYTLYEMPHSQLNSPPILLMHGLNLSRSSWRRTARHLVKQGSRLMISVDARNHGRSPHSAGHTPAHMAADVEAFMADHKLNRIVALGHSMGGRAMMTLALTKPKLVERAIIVDITPGPLPDDVVKALELFKVMVSVVSTIPKDFSLSKGRKHIIPEFSKLVKSDHDLLLIIQNLRKLDDGSFGWSVNAQAIIDGWDATMVNYEQTLQGLQPYQGETLLIAAKNESFVTPANVDTMRKYFPKLHVEYLDAEHKVHIDQPHKFVKLVVDFTKSCTACPL